MAAPEPEEITVDSYNLVSLRSHCSLYDHVDSHSCLIVTYSYMKTDLPAGTVVQFEVMSPFSFVWFLQYYCPENFNFFPLIFLI